MKGDDNTLDKNANSMCIAKVELEDTTVSWLLSVFQINLQKATQTVNPLLDAYATRAMLYWSKVIGLLSMNTRNEDRIITLFKHYLDEQKNPQSISMPAAIFFAALRYIRVTQQNQEKYLNFLMPYLQHEHKRTPDAVISSMLLTLCNIFRQCDFTNTTDKTIVLKLAETNELLKKLADKRKLTKAVKKQCYITNICFLLRSPDGLFKTLSQFLDKRCLSHLDEPEKSEQCLDMLIYLFQGTHDPFCSFFELPSMKTTDNEKENANQDDDTMDDIAWNSKIRGKENEADVQQRAKHIFKALVKKNTLKLLRQRHWKKVIFVMTLLISQDLEYGVNELMAQLVDNKKGTPLTMELALDVISQMMRPTGSFSRRHDISKACLQRINDILPQILEECEQAIGIAKLHKRETPLLMHHDGRYIDRYSVKSDPTNIDRSVQNFQELLRINMDDNVQTKSSQSTSDNGAFLNEEEKVIYDEEKSLLDDINYKQIRDAQLLSLSFLRNDDLGAKVLQLRQKHRGYDDIELSMKTNKGAKKEYLNVLRACIRCILSLRPNAVLTDCTVKNLTYIGRYLLHPDYEIVMTTYGVLRSIVKEEKLLLSAILTGLTNFLLQFYIHRASCISILIQTISGLVSTFIDSHSSAEILADRGIVDDLCFAFNRLDALAFAFFCHTNLYVRYSCIKLTLSVQRGLKIIIAHYFTDQSPDEQQRQLTFPSSLGSLFQLYSSDIISRARRKYFSHRDNMDKTGEAFDKYFNEHYVQSVENISHEGILKMLLVQDDYTPFFACMDAIVEKIESLCLDGSIYFKFLRVDSCQEILLQENWLGVDEQSRQSEILQSMCVALVSLIGFSDNGMDDNGFYDSIWKQLERFSHVNDATLVHTVLYALQSAHFTRITAIFESLQNWYESSFENIPNKMKKKKKKRIFQNNCVRVWLHVFVVLSLTGTERLFETFLSEIKLIQQENQQRNEQHKKIFYLHQGLITFCNNINTEHILKHTNSDPEVLRSVARIIENVAITLYKVYQRTKYDWVLRLWSAQDRASLLSTLAIWSQCTTEPNEGKHIVNSIKSKRTKYKDKELDRKEEKKINRRIKRIEVQSSRAATALLCLGPALEPQVILGRDDNEEKEEEDDSKDDGRSEIGSVYSKRSAARQRRLDQSSKPKPLTWFSWAVNAQKEGVPALKYLMKNHYALILKSVLEMLYSEQARGTFDVARVYFDVITSLELPDENEQEFDKTEIQTRLVVFCLMYLVPFIPHQLIEDAKPHSHHRRDQSSIITFRGVPVDNFGSNYAVSLPSAMEPAVVHNIQNSKPQQSCYNRPRLLSAACVQSMGRGSYMDKMVSNQHGKVVVELVDDIMQAIDMSRKTFSLFYKVVLALSDNKIPTLDKLHELRMGLQSNDLRDVRQNASDISWIFANVCPTEKSILITDEMLNTLEMYAERIEALEERAQLQDASQIHDQITLLSNVLQVALPWFAAAPLHQRKEDRREEFLDKLLTLTLRFKHFNKPEIDNAFYRIWHVLVTSNDTIMSSPEPQNIDYTIRFLVQTVCGRYNGYSEDMAKIEKMEEEAISFQQKHGTLSGNGSAPKKRKKKSMRRLLKKKRKNNNDLGAEYQGPTLEELNEFKKEALKPEQFISLCESIIKQIFATHPECVLSSLLQLISVGCGLGGHVLDNADHIQISKPGQGYIDSSYQLGGPKYSLLVTEIAIRWFTSLATKSFNKIQQCLPILLVHSLLFLTRTFEDMSNVSAEFISHLFVSLLPPKLAIDDEVIQIALWLRDRRTYQFKWSDDLINTIEPEKSRMIYKELADAFDDNANNLDVYRPFDLRRFFARQNVVYIDDIVRILFNCYRHRYGDREAAVWGLRALQWATVDVDKEEEATVYFSRIMASHALRLFSIISQPKTLRSVTLILKSILTGLRASEQFWKRKEMEEDNIQKYDQEDMHLSMAIRGIEALVSIVRTEDWNRTLFRMMLVAFWIALSLLQCRIARVQIAARRLLRTTLQHRPWLVYLFGQAKDADGSNLKKGSVSLEMFWSFYKLFEHDFGGIQERVISALIFSIGDDSPVTLNTDIMMILCCVWLIRCDVLHDRNISSRLAANLSFFLPYACTLLSTDYFQSSNIEQHLTGHRKEETKSNAKSKEKGGHVISMSIVINDIDGEDEEDAKNNNNDDDEQLNGKELRDKYDSVYRLRKENARIFKTLALYIQQNVIKEEKGKQQVRLADIDINDKNALNQYAMPDWSKVNKNFRQTYVGIYDVVSHIATALMASWTMDEPSTMLALGDFCQYLIDVFIPTNAATLANVFSICLLIGDQSLKIGTIRALQLFVPRLFKQCRSMNIFEEVIACFDETFERCTNLTSDENDRVAQCAHDFVFELTKRGYKASSKESKLMRSMYPSFKEVDLNDDGVGTTIQDLTRILEKTEDLLLQYPDNQPMDKKLERLLHMKPRDTAMNRADGVAAPQGQPMQNAPRRESQMQPPQKYQRPNQGGVGLKNQPSFLQSKDEPLQHRGVKKEKPLAFKPQRSILPEDEENDYYEENPMNNNGAGPGSPREKPQHRGLLSTVTNVSNAPEPQIMNMGSVRKLPVERHMTVEKLEEVVDKQLMHSDDDKMDMPGAANGGGKKYNKFGSSPQNLPNDDDDDDNQDEQKVANPNSLPYGMDTRPSYIKAQAAKMRGAGHERVPTFGASANLQPASAPAEEEDEDEDDDEEEIDQAPQQFPKFSMPGAGAAMKKDYDPLESVNDNDQKENNNAAGGIARPDAHYRETSDRAPMGEGGPGGANDGGPGFDIPPMEEEPDNDAPAAAAAAVSQPSKPQKKEESKANDNSVPVGDLSTFLDDTTLLRTFLKFLKKKTDDYKLLEFYLMAGQFKTHGLDPKSTRSVQRNNAKLIIETFFLPDSKKFLEKIQGMTRHEAMSQFLTAGKNTDLDPTLFDAARQEVKGELISRVFPIFMQSDRYKKLVDEGKVRPP